MNLNKFIVISNARSGTSLLTETLNSHPEIVCHGEIFHPDLTWHLKGDLANLSIEEKNTLRLDHQEYIKRVFNQKSAKSVGAKMWQVQNPDFCEQVLQDKEFYKIIYERENKLAQFASGMLARQTGIWNLPSGEKISSKVPSLDFSKDAFKKFLTFQSETFEFYNSRASGNVIKIFYHEIATDGFSKVFEFLGVSAIDLKPAREKLHSSAILSRFKSESHPLIQEVLRDMNCEHWRYE